MSTRQSEDAAGVGRPMQGTADGCAVARSRGSKFIFDPLHGFQPVELAQTKPSRSEHPAELPSSLPTMQPLEEIWRRGMPESVALL